MYQFNGANYKRFFEKVRDYVKIPAATADDFGNDIIQMVEDFENELQTESRPTPVAADAATPCPHCGATPCLGEFDSSDTIYG